MPIPFRYFLIIGVLFLCLSCDKEKSLEPGVNDNFAIYIASDSILDVDTRDEDGALVDQLTLLQAAFLSTSDITNYSWDRHRITYPDSVWERLKTWGHLINRLFVVSVGNERIYWGMFKDVADSGGCQNPVIMLLCRHSDGRNTTPQSLSIHRAYPGYDGDPDDPDLRMDPRIYNALEKAGVLIP
ncbi:MAG: hypothetical protein B1H02_00335 [Candidatus Latescibacteria bacterium 4484_107]|nr:MAG: hypothetical protein B1H02_00335 [Candidatus Latescibacteria bacterium 4484_107]